VRLVEMSARVAPEAWYITVVFLVLALKLSPAFAMACGNTAKTISFCEVFGIGT
jgi:hypothetical protein